MNIYLVKRTDKFSYDDYDSFVCIAPDAQTALDIIPGDTNQVQFYKDLDLTEEYFTYGYWTHRKNRIVEFIGEAHISKREIEIICQSFNAG